MQANEDRRKKFYASTEAEDEILQKTMQEIEADVIQRHLAVTNNHTLIAKKLGITRQTLLAKIKRYRL